MNSKTIDALVSQEHILEHTRTGSSPEILARAFIDNLHYVQGRPAKFATLNDRFMALAYTLRDRMLHRWIKTVEPMTAQDFRMVGYLSAEYLPGPHLENSLINLGIYENARQAMSELNIRIEDLIDQETDPGLGNGGLGRLAACYLDSMSTLGIPVIGYGIRYEFGIFDQEIKDGWQVEISDTWLQLGNPWEISRPELSQQVKFGGKTVPYTDPHGRYKVRWVPDRIIRGVPFDTPIPGYQAETCNILRLWKAQAMHSFNFQAFNAGDYYAAVDDKISSENITKVLYPNDEPISGKVLRLEQQFFFVSCSLQDMIRLVFLSKKKIDQFPEMFSIQLNDTHPAIAVAELMRLLIDEHDLEWDHAWDITKRSISYTNHTLLPEALEKWSVELLGKLLPRHLEIIYEINHRFLEEVSLKYPGEQGPKSKLSIIDESDGRAVRMANLASVASHTINGVAKLHTELLKDSVLREFYEIYPEKFASITNGVTLRRWIAIGNPRLTRLLTEAIGDRWLNESDPELRKLEQFAEDAAFQEEWRKIKRENKIDLAQIIRKRIGVEVDPDSMFDIQVKRIHEYKRQHLNVLHIIALYYWIKKNPEARIVPRTFIFAGKSAPGYFIAKLIIKLIHSVANVVNTDKDVAGRLKVVFLPDYNVKNSMKVYPAADLSEQISTAGKEASGTGNMKFCFNGALTIGTLDGANVEIRDEVGHENFFLFGLTAAEVSHLKQNGYYPHEYLQKNLYLNEALGLISSGHFSDGDKNLFAPLVNSLLSRDEFMLMADFQPYIECQSRVSDAYQDQNVWTRMSILNVARMGKFSSDRSIQEYCERIWKIKPTWKSVSSEP